MSICHTQKKVGECKDFMVMSLGSALSRRGVLHQCDMNQLGS